MGGYQLTLQAGAFTPAARLDANRKNGSRDGIGNVDVVGDSSHDGSRDGGSRGSGRGKAKSKKTGPPMESSEFGLFQSKRFASQQNLEHSLEDALQATNPPRHSTACCDGFSLHRETPEWRLSSQRAKLSMSGQVSVEPNCVGHSFRLDDGDNLALWEEKETSTAADQGWMKLTATQSPRWLDSMWKFHASKLAPWRSSPVHPKSEDTPRVSLDRKPSTRSLHESSKAWYNKKISRHGENRSVRNPTVGFKLVRQSGELNPALVENSVKRENFDGLGSEGGRKHNSGSDSFSRSMEEDTRFTASAVAWDISQRADPVVPKPRPVDGTAWEIPARGGRTADSADVDENLVPAATDAQEAIAQTREALNAASEEALIHDVKDCEGSSPRECTPSDAFFDEQSEYASCRTFVLEDESLETDSRFIQVPKSASFVNVIDFVAPVLTKLQTIEKEDSPAMTHATASEKRVSFKWEAPQGKQLRVEEVAPSTETPQPPPCAMRNGTSTSYESLRQQHLTKSKSAPLDGLYVFLPRNGTAKTPLPWEMSSGAAATDTVLTKSKSYNDALQRANSSPDRRVRESAFGANPGTSPPGMKVELAESSSPRSILSGPDDCGSLPSSSNSSLRSDPGTPASSARPTFASQSMSSCSVSFDLNDSDYRMISSRYNLNSTAACVIVESRRVSLSFRDFGPAQDSREGVNIHGEVSEKASPSNAELGCDGRLDTNALRSLSETLQNPELWTATFSTRYQGACGSPPDCPCTATGRGSEFSASDFTSPEPVRQLAYLMSCEDEELQRPIAQMQKSRSRNGEFTARLGVMFSPLRLISSYESSNHGCFVSATLSPPRDEKDGRSPTFATLVSPVELHSSSTKVRKWKSSRTNGDMVKSRSSKRRHASDEPKTMMVTFSKAMKKILAKCSVKRSTSKGKSKVDSPALTALPPPEFHFT